MRFFGVWFEDLVLTSFLGSISVKKLIGELGNLMFDGLVFILYYEQIKLN